MQFLRESEQHLFRRGQLRQILIFLRDHDRESYLSQLQDVLAANDVRFHLKRLVFAWLGSLVSPWRDEWRIIEPLLATSDYRRHILGSLRNNLGWFDLLLDRCILPRWLAGSDEDANTAIWILHWQKVRTDRSSESAKLLSPYVGLTDGWNNVLGNYFRYGDAYRSSEMRELFLKALSLGVFRDEVENDDGWWHRIDDASDHAPEFALQAICSWLERKAIEFENDNGHKFTRYRQDHFASKVIQAVAASSRSEFVKQVLPRFLKLVRMTAEDHYTGMKLDRVSDSSSNWGNGVGSIFYVTLSAELESLASENPEEFTRVTGELLQTNLHAEACLLLRGWSTSPAAFADTCISFILADERRLNVGLRNCHGGGVGAAAITREAIQTCVGFASPSLRASLEEAILNFSVRGDEGDYEGWHARLLLESFGEKYLTPEGLQRLTSLREKFPKQETSLPSKICSDSRILPAAKSPVSEERGSTFTDDDWLAAMRRYDYGWEASGRISEDGISGSAVELSRMLRTKVDSDPIRYARLVHRMEDSIRPEYFEAILDGLCGAGPISKEQRDAALAKLRELDLSEVVLVIQRLHALPKRPCGRAICRAFEELAERPISSNDFEILRFYALNDPDPAEDYPANSEEREDNDCHFQGYNSVRGMAARTIASLLFSDYSRSEVLVPIIAQMVGDPSMAVRSCVIEALMPIWNHDRELAVKLFCDLCRGHKVLTACYPYGEFLRHAGRSYYSDVRQILLDGLSSNWKPAEAANARQLCLAAFENDLATKDAEQVWNGTEPMRRAAAEVYAYNCADAEVGPECIRHLERLFDDESDAVREMAAGCFNYLRNAELSEYSPLIEKYVESAAFPSRHDHLLRRLDDSNAQLPSVTVKLAQRFVARCGSDAGNIATAAAGDAPTVSKLVVRLYSQTSDEVIRRECLDIIDDMERFGFYGIDTQLAEHDR